MYILSSYYIANKNVTWSDITSKYIEHIFFIVIFNIQLFIYFSPTRYTYKIIVFYLNLEKGNRWRFWHIESIRNGWSQWSYNRISTREWNYEDGESSIRVYRVEYCSIIFIFDLWTRYIDKIELLSKWNSIILRAFFIL